MSSELSLDQVLPTKIKLLIIFNILICLCLMLFCGYFAKYFTLDIFYRINSGSYIVEVAKFGGFLVFGGLAVFIFMLLLILRLMNKLSRRINVVLGKSFTYLAVLSILSTLAMWPIINHQLDKHNYSYCFFYTGSNMFSPPVYVNDPRFCFKGSRSVTDELFAWFDEQEAAGVKLKPMEVKRKIDALKEEKGTDW